jgi:hypothetical protein
MIVRYLVWSVAGAILGLLLEQWLDRHAFVFFVDRMILFALIGGFAGSFGAFISFRVRKPTNS